MLQEETRVVIAPLADRGQEQPRLGWFYAFFFVSGFCGLMYELVWLRLAMAQFGVTTVLTATFLSVFMAGIGLGAWMAGRWTHGSRLTARPITAYAFIELLIGLSALVVPYELRWGHELLLRLGGDLAWTSSGYSLFSGIWLALALIPWCACMGATFPLAMAAQRVGRKEEQKTFSYLYLANVLGAMAGVIFPLLLIEQFGMVRTLGFGALLNVGIAGCALLQWKSAAQENFQSAAVGDGAAAAAMSGRPRDSEGSRPRRARGLLFAMGLTTMGMEVVWIRIFTPYLGTVVYGFAAILGLYLAATFVGTKLYRRGFGGEFRGGGVWLLLGVSGVMPLIFTNPTLVISPILRTALGIVPLAMVAGFVTPLLIDRESQGDPASAGSAYSINVMGCILGPLAAGFFLLPHVSERWALGILSLPWLVIGTWEIFSDAGSAKRLKVRGTLAVVIAVLVASLAISFGNGFEEQFPERRVLRDSTATVIATGTERSNKELLVNGYGMSHLDPITKMMAHLPLAFAKNPRKVLVICFGMGTTHRSALSWEIDSTAVELTPSVPKLFSYYEADGDELLKSPRSKVIIDDGRRYLERGREIYDVIAIDPPPPVQAAGSSLLYSREFYEIAKRRLSSSGILQQWLPSGDAVTVAAVARALTESFPFVRVFVGIGGHGVHFLASRLPLSKSSAGELSSRLPAGAVTDLLEWGPGSSAEEQFDLVLRSEIPVERLIADSPETAALRDDRPVNEYFLLRSLRHK